MENKNTKVSLEALVKLKKAERPDAQFWDRFDRELNVRALQNCIKKDAWYEVLVRTLTERLLPIASATALCLFVGVSAYLGSVQQMQDANGTVVLFQEEALNLDESNYLLAGNEAVSKDYTVEIISLSNGSNDSSDLKYEEDLIAIAIGETTDYSELMASSNTLNASRAYTQLASYAF